MKIIIIRPWGAYRVYRGGCWDRAPVNARVAFRYRYDPGYRDDYLGLRLLLMEVR